MHACINHKNQIWKAYLESSRILSFGRGKGLSFRAGDDMSPFKAETARAFLNLFPRSRMTIGIRGYVGKEHTNIHSYWHQMYSQPTWKQITGCLATNFLVWRIGSRLMFVRYVCFWHLFLKWAAFFFLNILVSASEINYREVWTLLWGGGRCGHLQSLDCLIFVGTGSAVIICFCQRLQIKRNLMEERKCCYSDYSFYFLNWWLVK